MTKLTYIVLGGISVKAEVQRSKALILNFPCSLASCYRSSTYMLLIQQISQVISVEIIFCVGPAVSLYPVSSLGGPM